MIFSSFQIEGKKAKYSLWLWNNSWYNSNKSHISKKRKRKKKPGLKTLQRSSESLKFSKFVQKKLSVFGHLCFGLTQYVIKLDTTEQTRKVQFKSKIYKRARRVEVLFGWVELFFNFTSVHNAHFSDDGVKFRCACWKRHSLWYDHAIAQSKQKSLLWICETHQAR